jgi:hypothetical protein
MTFSRLCLSLKLLYLSKEKKGPIHSSLGPEHPGVNVQKPIFSVIDATVKKLGRLSSL